MKEEKTVICKIEKVIIPTYGIGKPEKNPIFSENRVYQGSSGVVYPNPITEKIFDAKENKEWLAIYLENKYLKIMILPELGGRVQMAYDKIKKRHFVYYNSVIKPALVGLTGPWISGGIEFNWPQHHRPSTYEPVDYCIEENKDGSITVWCSEIERMFRTKGMAGFTLHKDKAYLEIKVKLYNRTSEPQTFLWWANPAVKVNDDYQSVFPPDVYAVFDHGKRDVSEYPIAKGTYYKVDYSSGVDISRYKNIPVPTSFMSVESKYNFVGCYENDTKGGMLHVANHHISPGKKQWTWGNGDFGRAWDRNLTDEDGPYIELMCGVYTDNQPDFSWLMPNEEKSFSQYFMPYHEIGLVKNASKDVLVNLEFENNKAKIRVYTTSEFSDLKIILYLKNQILFEDTYNSLPETSYKKSVELYSNHAEKDFTLTIVNNKGKKILEYKPELFDNQQTPEPAKAIKLPRDIDSVEKLYLAGLHLEQSRHATFNPTDYYLEALKREPDNIRNNNAMGMWLLKRGRFDLAEQYFRKAIETITTHNPNPYDGEPFYNLGLSLFYQEKFDEAYNYFYKTIWNSAWQENGYFQLAKILCIRNEFSEALDLVEKSLIKNCHNHKARHLKVAILRKLDKLEEALNICEDSLILDRFNFGVLYEKYLLTKNDLILNEFLELIRNNVHTYIEYALDYAHAGYYHEATSLLELYINNHEDVYPIAGYFLGWFSLKCDNEKNAKFWFMKAEHMNPDYCFPNRLEEVIVLQSVLELLPESSKANYYLGNFWYASRQYEKAIECWENSRELDNSYPTVRRNLALAYFNKLNNSHNALIELEKAFELDPSDARILMELDQLYKMLGKDFEFRLSFLEKHLDIVNFRDDLYLERITLLNFKGKFEEALELLLKRKFHPWEGGEGKVTGQYIFSLIEMAKQNIKEKNAAKAIELLERAKIFPHNLGEGKLEGAKEIDINYWLGCANEIINNNDKAIEYWKMASEGDYEPSIAIYYNDQKPDNIFYQGLALLKLSENEKANHLFKTLIEYGKKHINDHIVIDYFAVSLPDLQIWEEDLNKVNRLHCQYLIALGYLGKEKEEACKLFHEILNDDMYNIGAHIHQQLKFV